MPILASEQQIIEQIKRKREKIPDQAEAIDLQLALLSAEMETQTRPVQPTLTAERATELRRLGIPLVTGQNLELDWDAFTGLFHRVCRITAGHRADLAGALAALEQQAGDEPELVKSWINQYLVGDSPQGAVEPGITTFCLTHALRPFLRNAARATAHLVDENGWKRNVCPICGGEADMASLSAQGEGARHLLCSRCDYEWPYRRIGCPFCESDDHNKVKYYPEEGGPHRLYVCDNCKRYLKVIDLRQAPANTALPAERVTTLSMDVIAREQGYF